MNLYPYLNDTDDMACGKTELCIFDSALPQIAAENGSFQTIYPVTSIGGSNPNDLEFVINASDNDYLDFGETLMSLRVLKGDGKPIDKDVDIEAENYLFESLFADVVMFLNNTLVEGSSNMYSQKAKIESKINYSTDTKNTVLTAYGYTSMDIDRR